jgi:hypothetical protein
MPARRVIRRHWGRAVKVGAILQPLPAGSRERFSHPAKLGEIARFPERSSNEIAPFHNTCSDIRVHIIFANDAVRNRAPASMFLLPPITRLHADEPDQDKRLDDVFKEVYFPLCDIEKGGVHCNKKIQRKECGKLGQLLLAASSSV